MADTDGDDATALLLARLASLDDCDRYVVLVLDPETGEVDAHGPYDGLGATLHAEQLRSDLDRGNLPEVLVQVTRLHHPALAERYAAPAWLARKSPGSRAALPSRTTRSAVSDTMLDIKETVAQHTESLATIQTAQAQHGELLEEILRQARPPHV